MTGITVACLFINPVSKTAVNMQAVLCQVSDLVIPSATLTGEA